MDMKKVAELVKKAEGSIDEMNQQDGTDENRPARIETWKDVQKSISDARAEINHSNARSDEQMFIRKCVLERIERLEVKALNTAL